MRLTRAEPIVQVTSAASSHWMRQGRLLRGTGVFTPSKIASWGRCRPSPRVNTGCTTSSNSGVNSGSKKGSPMMWS